MLISSYDGGHASMCPLASYATAIVCAALLHVQLTVRSRSIFLSYRPTFACPGFQRPAFL